jgi:ABC-type nitrate/sulfonate/bicarbonate transport system substrate-binding protein
MRAAALFVAFALISLGGPLPASAADPAPLDVAVGYTSITPSAISFTSHPILTNMPEFFAKAGIKVDSVNIQMGDAVQMMMAGNPAIVEGTGLGTTATGAQEGATDIKIFLAETERAPYELIVRKGVTRMDQIKTLGVPGITSASSQYCQQILKTAGLSVDKNFDLVLLGTSGARVAAVQAGKVDASCELSPFPELYKQQYGLETLHASGALPYFAAGAWAYSTKWGADPAHHEMLVRLAEAVLMATKWSIDPANKSKVIDMVAKSFDVPRSAAEAFYHVEIEEGGLSPDAYIPKAAAVAVGHAMVAIGAMPKEPASYAQYFDWSILQTAAQRLKIKIRKSEY